MARNKYLTWDDLADLYAKRTGGRAKIRPMDEIYEWAVKQDDITETDNGLILKPTDAPDISNNSTEVRAEYDNNGNVFIKNLPF